MKTLEKPSVWNDPFPKNTFHKPPLVLSSADLRKHCDTEATCQIAVGPMGTSQGKLYWKPGSDQFIHQHSTGEHTYDTIEEAVKAFNDAGIPEDGCNAK